MNNRKLHPHLQAQEANTTKHINFREAEEADTDTTSNNKTARTEDESLTEEAWTELREKNEARS